MAEKLGDAVLHLRTDDSALDDGLKRARGKAEGLATDFDALGQRMVGIGSKLSIGLTAPLILFGRQSTLAASDAAELQSAFNVTFGDMSAAMNEWAEKTGDAMGRSTQEMQRGANMFGLFFNQAAPTKQAAAEMSQSFAVLAQDLSSFYNVDPGVALEKLRSGLSGETEPLRDFGIFLTEASVGAKALEMGLAKTTKELTEQDKVMARAALIMEATKNAQGDVARTSDGTANQIRKSKAAWEELQVTIGTKLLPAVTPLITVVGDLLTGFSQLPGPVQTGVVGFLALSAAVGPLLMGIGGLIGPIAGMITGLRGLKAAFDFAGLVRNAIPIIGALGKALMGLALNPVFLIIAALIAGVYLAWRNWDKIKPIIDAVGKALSDWWTGSVQPVLNWVGDAIAKLVEIFTTYFGGQVKAMITMVSALLRGDFKAAWAAAKDFVMGPMRALQSFLQAFAPGVVATMRNLYTGIKQWLQDALGKVFTWLQGRLEAVGKWFFDLYDAVVGHSYVPDMVRDIGTWFGKLQGYMVDPARKATAETKEFFRQLADDVSGIMAELFPENAEFQALLEKRAKLDLAFDKKMISRDAYNQTADRLTDRTREAESRARAEAGIDDTPAVLKNLGDAAELATPKLEGLTGLLGVLPEAVSKTQMMLREFGEGLGNDLMGGIRDVLTGRGSVGDVIADLFSRFLDNMITNVLRSLEVSTFGEGGLGGFLGSVFAGLFASGGTIRPGTFGIVGERGPEPVIATPRGAVVRPNRALGEAMGQPSPSVVVPISIDATGADPAALERVRAEVAGLRRELPGTIISTMQDANERRIVRGNTW